MVSTTRTASAVKFKCFYLVSLVTAAILLTILRVFLFEVGRSSSLLIPVLTAVALAAFGVAAFRFRERLEMKLSQSSLSSAFTSSAIGFLFLAVLLASLYFSVTQDEQFYYGDINPIVSMLVKVFAVFSGVYFLMNAAWAKMQEHFGAHLFFSFAPVLFFACRVLNEFINNSKDPLNGSRGYMLFSLIFSMLFFLQESKGMAYRCSVFLHLLFGAGAVLFGAEYDATNLILYLNGESTPMSAIYSLLSVALCIHMIIRMASLPASFSPDAGLEEDEDGMILDNDVFYAASVREDAAPEKAPEKE